MKKAFTAIALFLLVCMSAAAQPVIHNLEDFAVGTILRFEKCETQGVQLGDSGANKFWDYSRLNALHDTLTEWMVAPAATPASNLFPKSNLVEKYSDGRYVYINKISSGNYLVGYVDTSQNISTFYSNPMLFAQRPMSYLQQFSDSYADSFTVSGAEFRGTGIITALADGYGTLKLPNATYTNVLRVKIYQEQTDTMIQSGTETITKTFTYAWFDDQHRSALLKIDSVDNNFFSQKQVEYLIQEQTTSVSEHSSDNDKICIFPNPVNNWLVVTYKGPNSNSYELTLTDACGRLLHHKLLTGGRAEIDLADLPKGTYQLNVMGSGRLVRAEKLVR